MILPRLCIIYILYSNTLPLILKENNCEKPQKRGVFIKGQIAVQLNASRVKKNDPTLLKCLKD